MQLKVSLLLLLLGAVLALQVDGHRRHRKGSYSRSSSRDRYRYNDRHRYQQRRPPPGSYYGWTRDVGDGLLVHEGAFIPQGIPIINVQSIDPALQPVNIQPANTIYDFTGPVPIQVISPQNGSCYFRPITDTFATTLQDVSTLNATIVNSAGELPLDGTATPLTPTEAAQLFGTNPSLIPLCDSSQLVPVYPVGVNPIQPTVPLQDISVFTLDPALVRITVPAPPPPPPPRRYRHRHHSHRHRYRHRH